MMKHKRADIDLLLGALLFFSAVLGLFHSSLLNAKQKDSINAIGDQSIERVVVKLQPLIATRSVERLVDALSGVPIDKLIPILEAILSNEQLLLDRTERIEVLLGAAMQYKNSADKFRIYDLILDKRYPMLREGNPIIYIAAASSYPESIQFLIQWYAGKVAHQKNKQELKYKIENNALKYASRHDDLEALRNMEKYGIDMQIERISHVLHNAVKDKVKRRVLHYIIDLGADIDYVIDGHTPLIHAVKNNDMPTVQLLVERGADINKLADNAVGNAVQNASGNHFVDIEIYLRDNGGKY